MPLYCATFIKNAHNEAVHHAGGNLFQRFVRWFNRRYDLALLRDDIWVKRALKRPWLVLAGGAGIFVFSVAMASFLGLSFFPRTDPGQFVINVKASAGMRLEQTDKYIARVEKGRSRRCSGEGPRHDRFEHQADARFFCDLYEQFDPEHGV